MNVLNYIFYRAVCMYENGRENNHPDIPAAFVTTTAELLYFISLIFFFSGVYMKIEYASLIAVVLLIINKAFFFNRKKFKHYSDKWKSETKNQRLFRGILSLLFLVFSLPFHILFCIVFKIHI